MPDTLQLSANEKLLTVGLRIMPAQIAMVDTATLQFTKVTDRTKEAGPPGCQSCIQGEKGGNSGRRRAPHHAPRFELALVP